MEDSDSAIASGVAMCIRAFSTFHSSLESSQEIDPTLLGPTLAENLGRFKIWAGNVGAHQFSRKSSLDYRLRNSPHIKNSVLQLLSGLGELLLDGVSISSDSRRISEDVTELDESDSDSGDSIPHSEHPSEIEQIFEDLSQNVTLLYRLSMTIRSGKWSNRYIKSASEPTADTSYFEEYDIRYVQDKFPEAPKYLAERLGKANSRRRQYLKYRERHAAKLAYAIDENKDDVAPSETIASVIPRDLITSHKVVDDLQSETSYATSVGVGNSSRMPKMPKQGVDEQPFECPYCHTIEVVKNTHDWRKHVFRDLEAFVCTFPDCTTPNETYGSRRDWFMHEISDHRRVWTCGGHCNREFRSGKELINHMKLIGSIDIADKQISALLEMRSSPISKTAEFCCPLCQAKPVGTSSLRRHLGRHLQDISLFALPMLDNEDDESSTGSDPTEPDLKARDLDEAREESSLKNRDSGLGDNGVDLIALASSSSTDKNDKRSNRTANDEPIAPVTIPDDVVRDLKRLTGAMEPDRKRRMDKEKAAKEDEEFKAKEDEAYRERLRKQLASKGFPDAEIKRILEQPYTEDTKRKMEEEFKAQRSGQPLPFRPSFVKVNKKYLDPETLDKYKLPWEWDDRDPSYIIINQWIPEHDHDELFEHTRKLRENKGLAKAGIPVKKEGD